MAELREYRVTVNGHETVMNLSEEDAKRLDGTPVSDTGEPGPESGEKGDTAPNKSRAARNKSAE